MRKHNGADSAFGVAAGSAKPRKREQRRASLLMMARNAWYHVMDGHMPHDAWHMREIDNLLRRAKATRDDL